MKVLITATGTEVGKTWVGAGLLRGLRARGLAVAARKPAQSFESGPADADVLAEAAGCDPALVCPPNRSYPVPLAPVMAAARLGRPPFSISDLARELNLPVGGVAVVEGAGGWRSPLAEDGDTRALALALQPDLVVLVTEARLGAVHAVRSCLDTVEARATVFLNRFDAADPAAAATLDWLRNRDHLDVVTGIDQLVDAVAAAAASA